MLCFKNITFSYNGEPLIDNLSFTVNGGEIMLLNGASGSGKTTAVNLILGLIKPQSGEIITPEKISVVFQEDRLIENFSLLKNIRMVLKKENYPFADDLLCALNLQKSAHLKPNELSGGMKRRAALIRAIAFGGDALILDEPFNGIDRENKEICARLIKEHFLRKNKPVLLISHFKEDISLFDGVKETAIGHYG